MFGLVLGVSDFFWVLPQFCAGRRWRKGVGRGGAGGGREEDPDQGRDGGERAPGGGGRGGRGVGVIVAVRPNIPVSVAADL